MSDPAASVGAASSLPFTVDFRRTALRGRLLNANDANVCGAVLSARDTARVRQGLLQGWNADAAKILMATPRAMEPIEQAHWSEADAQFMRSLALCKNPEQVEAVMPEKWRAYDADLEFDSKLGRLCKLCTALVEKYVQWSSSDPSKQPATASEWRLMAQLEQRIQSVVAILEASLGESVSLEAFVKDTAYLRRCWASLDEEAQIGVEAALNHHRDVDLAAAAAAGAAASGAPNVISASVGATGGRKDASWAAASDATGASSIASSVARAGWLAPDDDADDDNIEPDDDTGVATSSAAAAMQWATQQRQQSSMRSAASSSLAPRFGGDV